MLPRGNGNAKLNSTKPCLMHTPTLVHQIGARPVFVELPTSLDSKIDFHVVKTKSVNTYMTLKEFVRDSLIEITNGIAEARANKVQIPKDVFQIPGDKSGPSGIVTNGVNSAFLIGFDVAVTVSDKTDAGGKAVISVAHIFSIEGGGNSGIEHSKVSRIQFKVPMIF
jgi:hypothetical protein